MGHSNERNKSEGGKTKKSEEEKPLNKVEDSSKGKAKNTCGGCLVLIILIIIIVFGISMCGSDKSPSSKKHWTFVKFDDTGKIVVMTKYSFDSIPEKQQVLCVFTTSGENFTSHYLSIGNTEYLNDGSCDAIFDQIKDLAK